MKKIFQTLSLAAVLCVCITSYSNCQKAEAAAVPCYGQESCRQAEDNRGNADCPRYQQGEGCRRDGEERGHHGRHGGCRW